MADDEGFSSDGSFSSTTAKDAEGNEISVKIPAPALLSLRPSKQKKQVSHVIQPWFVVESRLPDPQRAEPLAFPGEAGPASLTWGSTSDFNTDPPPEKPIEDAQADGLVSPG